MVNSESGGPVQSYLHRPVCRPAGARIPLAILSAGAYIQGMTEDRKLSTAEAAALCGMKPNSWRSRVSRTMAPPPDGHHDARTPWWYESTIVEFKKTLRPYKTP